MAKYDIFSQIYKILFEHLSKLVNNSLVLSEIGIYWVIYICFGTRIQIQIVGEEKNVFSTFPGSLARSEKLTDKDMLTGGKHISFIEFLYVLGAFIREWRTEEVTRAGSFYFTF